MNSIRHLVSLASVAVLASSCALLVGIEDHRLAGTSTAGAGGQTTTTSTAGGGGGASPGDCPAPDLGTTPCPPGLADCDDDGSCTNGLASDSQHCGACGHDCFGAACTAGVCQQVDLTPTYPVSHHFGPMTVFGGKVYYAAGPHDDNVIYSLPVTGGTPKGVSGGPVGQVYQLAVVSDPAADLLLANAYHLGGWTMHGMLANGGTPALFADLEDYTTGLAAGSFGVVYVSELHAIKRIPFDTAETIINSTDPIRSMAIDKANVYWVTYPDGGTGKGEVVSATLLGKNRAVLQAGIDRPENVALDDTWVYWADSGLGTLSRVPKAGGAAELLVSGQKVPKHLAVAGDDLFWSADDGLYRAALCDLGKSPVRLTSSSIGAVVTDGKRALATDTHAHQVVVFAR